MNLLRVIIQFSFLLFFSLLLLLLDVLCRCREVSPGVFGAAELPVADSHFIDSGSLRIWTLGWDQKSKVLSFNSFSLNFYLWVSVFCCVLQGKLRRVLYNFRHLYIILYLLTVAVAIDFHL